MLILISPAKTLDYSSPNFEAFTQPDFVSDVKSLVSVMKKKSAEEIASLMHISENLAQLNEERYKTFQKEFNPENSKQALLAFKGDVYTKIDVDTYTEEDFDFAQQNAKKVFIDEVVSNDLLFAFKIFLSRTGRPDTEHIAKELGYVSVYAIHKAKVLEEELWSVVGVGDVIDISDEIVLIIIDSE